MYFICRSLAGMMEKDGMTILYVIPKQTKSFRGKRYLRGMRVSKKDMGTERCGFPPARE
jgi:hypothetical protein